MRKLALLTLLMASQAFGAAVIFSGANVKTLKPNIDFNGSGVLQVTGGNSTTGAKFDFGSATSGNIATFHFVQSAARTYTLLNSSDTLVMEAATETLSNKIIGDPSDTSKQQGWDLSTATTATKTTLKFAQTAARTITFPDKSITVNKGTDIDSGVAANNTVLTANGSGGSSFATFSAGGITPGTDGQILKTQGSATLWSSYKDLPQAINYIANANAETNTNGWATYSNTAANTPANGTGGTATGLTFSRNTSSPIRGASDLKIVQTNSTNIQGKGVSYDFTIDPSDEGKVLSVSYDYNASSTFVASNGTTAPLNDGTTTTNAGNSDLEAFVYDKTNSQLLYINPQVVTSNGANNFNYKGTFQTNSNSTSYRLILHVATNNANATGWTFHYSNVYVGPQTYAQGPPVTDWATYVPTITGSTSNPTKASSPVIDQARWRRVGDSLELEYVYLQTSATGAAAGSGDYEISLPNGYTIDTTKVNVGTTSTSAADILGHAWFVGKSTGEIDGHGAVFGYNSSHVSVYLTIGADANGGSPALSGFANQVWGSGNNSLARTQAGIKLTATIPILGWSSSVQMSNETDTRVVGAIYHLSANKTPGANVQVDFDTKDYDSHGAVTTGAGAWKFTAPSAGIYDVLLATQISGTQGDMVVYKNGSANTTLSFANATNGTGSGSTSISLVAGDFIDIRPDSGATLLAGTTPIVTKVSIFKKSGPAAIASSEFVGAQYYMSGNTATNTTFVNYDTKVYDTHGAVTTGAGTWKFTAPRSGYYRVTPTTIGGATVNLTLYKNGSAYASFGQVTTSVVNNSSLTIKLVAGDTIQIHTEGSITITGGTQSTVAGSSYVMIESVSF